MWYLATMRGIAAAGIQWLRRAIACTTLILVQTVAERLAFVALVQRQAACRKRKEPANLRVTVAELTSRPGWRGTCVSTRRTGRIINAG